MQTFHDIRRLSATLIFDAEDRFARLRGARGPRPRPLEPIKFLATARMVGIGVRQDFDPPLELVVKRNGGGYHLFFNEVRLPDGTSRQLALPDGTYAVRAEGRFYQRVEREDVALPMPSRAIAYDLPPSYAYPFPTESTLTQGRGLTLLRGGLHELGGGGVAGARVEVVGMAEPYLTDETGQWVLVFPDATASGNVTVRVTFPDGSVLNLPNVPVVQGREAGLAQTAFRGWVLTQAGVGVRGAAVSVAGQPGRVFSGGDGGWTYYFGLGQAAGGFDVAATLPDGSAQTQLNQQVQPRATVVVPAFRF